MKNLAVMALAYERPKYLYILLDSIFRNKGIEQYPVYVMIDGEGRNNEEMKETIASFPTAGYLIRDTRLKCSKHLVRSVKSLLDFGYEYVLFLEEDIIIRSDVFVQFDEQNIEECLEEYLMCALKFTGGTSNHFRGFATLFQKRGFDDIFDFVVNEKYVGLKSPGGEEMHKNSGYQATLGSYMRRNNVLNINLEKMSCSHLGLGKLYDTFEKPTTKAEHECQELTDWLFSGPKESWLGKAVQLVNMELESEVLRGCVGPNVGFKLK